MYFDWVTWGIWLFGFIILLIWIVIPINEFKQILERKRQLDAQKKELSHTEENAQ